MSNDEFIEQWTKSFPECYPISHYFKHQYHDRWFRIHSLPDSKRYPTNKEDKKLLLIRYNLLITDFIGPDQEFYLLISSYDQQPGMPEGYEDLININIFTELDSLPMHRLEPDNFEDGDEYYLRMAVGTLNWQEQILDTLLLAVADNQISNVIIINKDFNRLLCPYDGGMDIILEQAELKNKYQKKYHTLLSDREDGL